MQRPSFSRCVSFSLRMRSENDDRNDTKEDKKEAKEASYLDLVGTTLDNMARWKLASQSRQRSHLRSLD